MTLNEAKIGIAEILAQLEKDTHSTVKSIYLDELDISNMGDSMPQRLVAVQIQLERQPGTHWGLGNKA